jgi:hypothetical protein
MLVVLSPDERRKLAEANRLLTELTESHSHACECELCLARVLTDVQDEASYTVPGVIPSDWPP